MEDNMVVKNVIVEDNTIKPIPWSEFKKLVGVLSKNNAGLIYRGQPNANWPIKTSFQRYSEITGVTLEKYLEFLGNDLCYYFSSRLNKKINVADELEYGSFLALLQNHGIPTPLLDWTESPYVATYFALRNCDVSKCAEVSVYGFDLQLWKKNYDQPNKLINNYPYISIVRPFAWDNARQIAQSSLYTATNIPDIEKHFAEIFKTKNERYVYVSKILTSEKDEILKELDLMNINEMTLFPDIDGLSRSLKN